VIEATPLLVTLSFVFGASTAVMAWAGWSAYRERERVFAGLMLANVALAGWVIVRIWSI